MFNVSEEETCELIVEFVRHVFEEVKTEGWKTRRDEFITQQDHYVDDRQDDQIPDDMTFDKAMEKHGDTDKIISAFLYPILLNPQWVEAWTHHLRPDLDQRRKGFCCYWSMWGRLNDFLYEKPDCVVPGQIFYVREINYDKVKEVLGLDFDLK